MAKNSDGTPVGSAPMTVVSPDNPRIVKRVSDGAFARVTDQGEYVSMTTAQGYRDVTDDADGAQNEPTPTAAPSGTTPRDDVAVSNVGRAGSATAAAGGSERAAGSGGSA